jgi:hypothetical protein
LPGRRRPRRPGSRGCARRARRRSWPGGACDPFFSFLSSSTSLSAKFHSHACPHTFFGSPLTGCVASFALAGPSRALSSRGARPSLSRPPAARARARLAAAATKKRGNPPRSAARASFTPLSCQLVHRPRYPARAPASIHRPHPAPDRKHTSQARAPSRSVDPALMLARRSPASTGARAGLARPAARLAPVRAPVRASTAPRRVRWLASAAAAAEVR